MRGCNEFVVKRCKHTSDVDQKTTSFLRSLFSFPLSPSHKNEDDGTGGEVTARKKEERKWITREVLLALLRGMKIYLTSSRGCEEAKMWWKPLRYDEVYKAIDPQTEASGMTMKSTTGIWLNLRLSWSMFVDCMMRVSHALEENKLLDSSNGDKEEEEETMNLADLSAQAANNPDVEVEESDWKNYNPSDVEVQEVQELFFHAGNGKRSCSLDALQLTLYMNRFLHTSVCEMMRLAEMLSDANGMISAVNFARVLACYRSSYTKISDVSFGMLNIIRLVLVRFGDPGSSLQVAHTLRQNVFLSLQSQVHKMGGEMNVEFVVLNNAKMSRRNQMRLMHRRKSSASESSTNMNLANMSKIETEMTDDDLIEYCEVCRSWAAHVWVCFIFDESVFLPSLPPRCTSEQFEGLTRSLQMMNERKSLEALNSSYSLFPQSSAASYCLEFENHHHHRKLLKELQRLTEDSSHIVSRLKVDVNMYNMPSEVLTSEVDKFQRLVNSFLSPNEGCSAMMKVEKRFPVFVILKENAENVSQQGAYKSVLEDVMSRIPPANKFRYKVSPQELQIGKLQDVSSKQSKIQSSFKGAASKLNKLTKMNSVFRNSSIHSPKKLRSMLEEMYHSDSDLSTNDDVGDSVLAEKHFLQKVAKEVKAMLSQALIRAIPPSHMIDNTVLHVRRLQSILYMLKEIGKLKDANGRPSCPVDNEQLAVVRAIVKYIDYYEYSKQGDKTKSNMEQAELMEERGKERKRYV